MLAFGRHPRSPIDMLISTGNTPTKVTGSASQYLETTVKKRQELSEIARENQECTQSGAKKKYDKGKKTSNITTGDWLMKNMKECLYTCYFVVRERTITIFHLFCINILLQAIKFQ